MDDDRLCVEESKLESENEHRGAFEADNTWLNVEHGIAVYTHLCLSPASMRLTVFQR